MESIYLTPVLRSLTPARKNQKSTLESINLTPVLRSLTPVRINQKSTLESIYLIPVLRSLTPVTKNLRANQGSSKLDNLFCGKGSSVNFSDLRLLEYMLQSRESSWRFPPTLPTILNLSLINLKRSSGEQLKSLHFFGLSLGPLLNLDLYHLNCFCNTQSDQSAQVTIYGNQKHNYLNAIKAVQLMVGKQLLISTSLINPFGTLVIDQHNR